MIVENLFDFLDLADKQATLLLNFDGGNIADAVFQAFSATISWIPLMLLFGYLLFKSTNGNLRNFILIIIGLVAAVTLADKISAEIIKPLAMRLRPSHNPDICMALHYVNGYRGGRYGFVSSHAANAFAAVMYASLVIRKRLFVLAGFSYALLVSYSRIYLGVHYLGDVVCGAVLGVVLALLVFYCVTRFMRVQIFRNFGVRLLSSPRA